MLIARGIPIVKTRIDLEIFQSHKPNKFKDKSQDS